MARPKIRTLKALQAFIEQNGSTTLSVMDGIWHVSVRERGWLKTKTTDCTLSEALEAAQHQQNQQRSKKQQRRTT